MKVKKAIFSKGLSYKLIVLIIIVVAVSASFVAYWFSQKEKLCNVEEYDLFYYLTAIKTNDHKMCDKIVFEMKKDECKALMLNDESFCGKMIGSGKESCIALAKKDVNLCKNDAICKALITKNKEYCASIDNQNAESTLIKQTCEKHANLDAEFFIAKEQLRKC